MRKTIHFFTVAKKFNLTGKKSIRDWLEFVIQDLGKVPGEINIIYTSDEKLRIISLKYLRSGNFTDTISFNLSEEEKVVSGDVYISIDRIRDNAKKYKVNFNIELRRVLIHSVLHLIGFSDDNEKQRKEMKTMENNYLKAQFKF